MTDWYFTKDGDLSCLALYERHYSVHRYKEGLAILQLYILINAALFPFPYVAYR